MMIHISPVQRNTTPAVLQALADLKAAGGGTLNFEKGEYHFFREGTRTEFMGISNNSACEKPMVFAILNAENIVVDGNGSVFVFHDVVFPFMISGSRNIVLRNMILDTGRSPLVEFRIHDRTDEGFHMDIDRGANPFFVEDGSLCFQRESEIVSGRHEFFSLHALGRHQVQYFATGDCQADMTNLPAPVMKCDVFETENGIYARYRSNTPSRCGFEDSTVSSIIDGKRNVDVICLNRSEDIEISNITVARGIGMGVIGQLSRNIHIDGFSTDIGFHTGSYQTLTADSMHFVNCDGALEIRNCTISDTMDDIINVHGMYTSVTAADENTLCSAIMHQEQRFFNPYRPGDRLVIINSLTFEPVAEFLVDSSRFREGSGAEIVTKGRFSFGAERIQTGFWIENPDRMPDVHLHHNHFYNFPHIRLSGGGTILVEDNRIADCSSALMCLDLARYWYESGRVRHLVYRNNILDNCNGRGGSEFIRIGIDGVDSKEAPKIHERIEIVGNRFSNIRQYAVNASGVKELIIQDNIFDAERENLFKI